jgi:hypothetical protein
LDIYFSLHFHLFDPIAQALSSLHSLLNIFSPLPTFKMHSFTAVVAASALLSAVSGSPLYLRSNTCGAAPAGSNTENQPIQQPTGIKTAADCQSQCNAASSCQSFCFGLIDNAIKCELFSVPAASIPKQSSTNLVAYDKACSAVPSVVPTSSNPTGKAQDNTQKQSGTDNTKQSGNTNTQPTTQQKSTTNTQSNNQPEPAKVSKAPTAPQQPTPTPTPAKQQQQQQAQQGQDQTQSQKQTTSSSAANTCGSKPAGTTNNQPLSQPSVSSVAACKTQCEANTSCKSFTCGTVNSAVVCKLFSVAASAVPAPADAAQKKAVVAYDVGCSV